MNALLEALSLQSLKPFIAALLLPPVPFLILLPLAALLLWRKHAAGWLLALFSAAGLFFGQSEAAGQGLSRLLLRSQPALDVDALTALARDPQTRKSTSIAVLGAGIEPFAPEYGVANLSPYSLERLRYGLWLGKRLGVPVGFSGGLSQGASEDDTPEALVAQRIASQEFGRSLQWVDPYAKDTHENALRSLLLLREAGVRKVIVVTHGWHMPRALKAFQALAGSDIEIVAAPMGMGISAKASGQRWLPSAQGGQTVRLVLKEWMGSLSGA
nr:YdcF family protein [uncultured Roseateles sp.]